MSCQFFCRDLGLPESEQFCHPVPPTRGNSSPKWNSNFATTRLAVFQLAAW